jgi:hypothetical protein
MIGKLVVLVQCIGEEVFLGAELSLSIFPNIRASSYWEWRKEELGRVTKACVLTRYREVEGVIQSIYGSCG